MRACLVLAALRSELAGLRRRTGELVRLQWPLDWCYGAKLGGRRLLLVANGPGERLAEAAADVARARESFDAVVSIGYCGALSPVLAPGDIFVATRVQSLARAGAVFPCLPETHRSFVTGTLLTADRVIQTASEKRDLHESGGDAVDMETAAVGERAVEWGLHFYSIRAVTDTAGEDLLINLNAARGEDGRFRTSRLLAEVVRRPVSGVNQLRQLRDRSRLAAERLGEFLAGCRF